jgi:hypothetical protein
VLQHQQQLNKQGERGRGGGEREREGGRRGRRASEREARQCCSSGDGCSRRRSARPCSASRCCGLRARAPGGASSPWWRFSIRTRTMAGAGSACCGAPCGPSRRWRPPWRLSCTRATPPRLSPWLRAPWISSASSSRSLLR